MKLSIPHTDENLSAAKEILEFVTGDENARIPHNPCVTYDTESQRLRFTSSLHPLGDSELMLIERLEIDSLGDGWEVGAESELLDSEFLQPAE